MGAATTAKGGGEGKVVVKEAKLSTPEETHCIRSIGSNL